MKYIKMNIWKNHPAKPVDFNKKVKMAYMLTGVIKNKLNSY